MPKIHLSIVLVLVACLFLLIGCGKDFQSETLLDKNWGKSFEAAKQNQILNPEAGKNLEPVVGMDGQSEEKIIEKHEQSFEKEPSKEVYNVNLGVLERE